MAFTVSGLSPEPFRHLYGLPDAELAAHFARRVTAGQSGFPERIELRDAAPGETLLLVHYLHQDVDSPFRASHAVYVREGATAAARQAGLPEVLKRRLLSLRAFSADGMLVDSDVVEGAEAQSLIERMLGDGRVAYLHAHSARPGCYLARIDRA
ncbi:MAG TPA: DUF1203 domain-containing protein [Sphingomicrobium sp.]|nr:DUF1203 domain-containing protein [Sphingomicrobium sp.]